MKRNGATIAPDVVARIVGRRGTEHCYAELDPAKTALYNVFGDITDTDMLIGLLGRSVARAA